MAGAAARPGPVAVHEDLLLKGHDAVSTAKHSDAPLEVQPVGGTTDGKQLWFKSPDNNGWAEVSFGVEQVQDVDLSKNRSLV